MINIKNLTVFIKNKKILDDINIHINKGETFVILGESGAGKTIFLKTVIGLIKADAGEIIICGANISQIDENKLLDLRQKTGMVFQSSALFDSLTIWENVGFFLLEHTNLSDGEIREKAEKSLNSVGLKDILDEMPEHLSGGMKKRVGIARALINHPEIIFYDEPTAGLDPVTSESILSLVAKIHKEYKTTDVIVTHDLGIAKKFSDRVAIIDDGRIFTVGTWEEVVKTGHPIVSQKE
ncbi:MAG: ATP-binding cassette domain-containing protein [Candidatus Omnitrophica bacterium]|nr:ATP-binding cassette domain-containing protein [Candidatus Omnitrophota bacterium]